MQCGVEVWPGGKLWVSDGVTDGLLAARGLIRSLALSAQLVDKGFEAQRGQVVSQDDITHWWQMSPLIVFLGHHSGPLEILIC